MLDKKTSNNDQREQMSLILVSQQGYELWLGSSTAAKDLRLLRDKKIKHVLTVAASIDISYPQQLCINHKILKAYDSPFYKMTPHFDESFVFIERGLKNGNVLVHCAAGISRSTTCVMAYLMKAKGYPFKQALTFTKSKRSFVNPNFGFQNELGKFHMSLKRKETKMTLKTQPLQLLKMNKIMMQKQRPSQRKSQVNKVQSFNKKLQVDEFFIDELNKLKQISLDSKPLPLKRHRKFQSMKKKLFNNEQYILN